MTIIKIKKPKLKFSNWVKWQDRNGKKLDCSGVYAISITNKNLANKSFNYKDVVYIGMSNARGGIRGRLNQFNRSINGGEGHSGGKTIYKNLGNYKKWRKVLYLYVSTFKVKCEVIRSKRSAKDLLLMGWVSFLEFEALAKCKQQVGTEPKYNKK